MADKKISQLTSATALAGTEVTPVVQGGTTKKATIDQILAPAAGKGIDFSANANAPGMTSELLNWYEAGTWTPSVNAASGTITSYTATATYTRIGQQVTVAGQITVTDNGTGAGSVRVGGLPFAASSVNFAGVGLNGATGATIGIAFAATNTLVMYKYDATYPVATGQQILFTVTYFV